jgi:UDP-N-acetylmuramoyl-L-alanyl-D-glutamate--2,6-diaminopimelate ligase
VEPGSAFIAVVGTRTDGHDHAADAVAAGAAALVVERRLDLDVPQLVVETCRPLMAVLAAEVHGHPAERMTLIGVTGTNAKTTVTHMLDAIGTVAGKRTGMVGTLGARIAGEPVPLGHTTPEATDLQRLLHRMADAGVELAAMEVSSHALSYGRADAIRFDVAGFTNLSQDHLDFHGDMESYFAAKRGLFTEERTDRAVIFTDDPWGARLAAEVAVPQTTVGFDPGSRVGTLERPAVLGRDLRITPTSATFDVDSRLGRHHVRLPFGGRFNAANALVAFAGAMEVGIDADAIVAGLGSMPTVPGRFETVDRGQPFTVIVDYAHTPEAMATVIEAVRPSPPHRLIAVGGAGGDRDRGKRPLMGQALAAADIAVITSDNPRTEDPGQIVAAVAAGVGADRGASEVVVEVDRRLAIGTALWRAEPGDVVVLLGKGHESGQEIDGVVHPFDDREVAAEVLRQLGHHRESS